MFGELLTHCLGLFFNDNIPRRKMGDIGPGGNHK